MAPSDPYVYPGTETLRNNFDIRDAARLEVVEASLTAMALAQLDAEGLPGGYDVAHLQAFHRAIFANVYPWAAQIRTVQISRTVPFAPPENIEPYLSGRLRERRQAPGTSTASTQDRQQQAPSASRQSRRLRTSRFRSRRHKLRWATLAPANDEEPHGKTAVMLTGAPSLCR